MILKLSYFFFRASYSGLCFLSATETQRQYIFLEHLVETMSIEEGKINNEGSFIASLLYKSNYRTRLSTFWLTVQVAEVRVARSFTVSKTAANFIVDVCRKRLIQPFSFH
jgi:hypothetical protein